MTDTLRNMPRYIRNTDAFGWQGADGPNGPWRSITPPQTGTPWQTIASMTDLTPNDLSHLSDDEFNALCPHGGHAPGPEPLSPAAQAVLDAAHFVYWCHDAVHVADPAAIAAATLRTAADQAIPLTKTPWGTTLIPVLTSQESRDRLLAIATELESHQ